VLGKCKDVATNLIPEYRRAAQLCERLCKEQGKEYGLIYCEVVSDTDGASGMVEPECRLTFLGYDVGCLIEGDYWSAIRDFPIAEWAKPFRALLNNFNLFSDRSAAEKYVREYIKHKDADWQYGFDIVAVYWVCPPDGSE